MGDLNTPLLFYRAGVVVVKRLRGRKKDDNMADDYEKGFQLNHFQTAAQEGDAEAQYQLGVYYSKRSSGLLMSFEESLKWIKLAAEQGHAKANFHLGSLYLFGDAHPFSGAVVCPKDEVQAGKCFSVALSAFSEQAERGNADAMVWLAAMYAKGFGVIRDQDKANSLLLNAAALGNQEAKDVLGGTYSQERRKEKHGMVGMINAMFK